MTAKGVARLMEALSDLTDDAVELSTWKPGHERKWRCKAGGATYDGATPYLVVHDAWLAWLSLQFREEHQ